jgi:hypothetical protein
MLEGHEQGRPVDHGRVDDLALPGGAGGEDPGEDAHGEEHPSPAEVAYEVERRYRIGCGADRPEHAGQGDVVDVVAGPLGEGAVLAPPGHATVDKAWVALQADVGAETEALGDSGPEPLEEGVGPLHEVQHHPDAVGVLEVDGDRELPTVEEIGVGAGTTGPGAVDADDAGAEVGEDHPAEGGRADPCELDDRHALQRTHPHPPTISKSTIRSGAYPPSPVGRNAPR